MESMRSEGFTGAEANSRSVRRSGYMVSFRKHRRNLPTEPFWTASHKINERSGNRLVRIHLYGAAIQFSFTSLTAV